MRAKYLPADAPTGARWGESWEFSTLPGSESRALGEDLSTLLGGRLPFLAKLIDTEHPLSIQVHPCDDASTGSIGKEEAWIILDAAPGAAVLAGVRDDVDAAGLRGLAEAAWADPRAGKELLASLERIEVQRGDVILVPGRTVHAIQGGILLAEIQQPSDCTYRLFDYGSDRQIHPRQALETIDADAKPQCWFAGHGGNTHLAGDHVRLEVLVGPLEFERPPVGSPALLVLASGQAQVSAGNQQIGLSAGDLCLWTHSKLAGRLEPGTQLVIGRVSD
jgi:mannose-6-phosphate isomerase class I